MFVGSDSPSAAVLDGDRPQLPWASRLICRLAGFVSAFFVVAFSSFAVAMRLDRLMRDTWLVIPVLCFALVVGACFGGLLCRWRDSYFASHPERSAIPSDILFTVIVGCWGMTLYAFLAPVTVASSRSDMDIVLALHRPSDDYARSAAWEVGTLVAYRSRPEGLTDDWAPCDGRTLASSDHPALARILLEGMDPGHLSASIRLPDYRGMFDSGSPPWVPESRPEDDSARAAGWIARLHLRAERRSYPLASYGGHPLVWYLKVR